MSNKVFASVWNAAFPGKSSSAALEQPSTVSVMSAGQPAGIVREVIEVAAPAVVSQVASAANSRRWEPFPGQKLLIGSVLAIPAGIAVAMGYNIGIPLTPGEGVQMAWGGVMGVFAHLRFRKMAG